MSRVVLGRLKAGVGEDDTIKVESNITDASLNPWGIESSSSSSGGYTKFPDGTLICWGEYLLPTGNTTDLDIGTNFTQFGTGGFWFAYDFTFPVAFVGVPHVNPSWRNDSLGAGEAVVAMHAFAPTTTGFRWQAADASSNSGLYSITYMAIGRWK